MTPARRLAVPQLGGPPGELRAGEVEHVLGEGGGEPAAGGDRDEDVRFDVAAVVAPPRQRLEPGHRPGGELDDRLEVRLDRAVVERLAQRLAQLQRAASRAASSAGRRSAKLPLPARLAVYTAMSAWASIASTPTTCSSSLERRDPDARGDRDGARPDEERVGERIRAGGSATIVGSPAASSSTANSSPLSRASVSPGRTAPREAARGEREQVVARGVAERVVDGLELVEVDQQHRDGPAVAGVQVQRVLDAVEEHRPVGQARQVVVEGVPRQRGLPVDGLGAQVLGVQDLPEQGREQAQQRLVLVQALRGPVRVEAADRAVQRAVAVGIGTPTKVPTGISRATPVAAYSGTAMASGANCGASPVTMCWQKVSDQAWTRRRPCRRRRPARRGRPACPSS